MLSKLLENLFIIVFGVMTVIAVIAAVIIPTAYLAKKDALHCLFDPNPMVCVELNEVNKKGKIDESKTKSR